jgi:hypothetical protein
VPNILCWRAGDGFAGDLVPIKKFFLDFTLSFQLAFLTAALVTVLFLWLHKLWDGRQSLVLRFAVVLVFALQNAPGGRTGGALSEVSPCYNFWYKCRRCALPDLDYFL